MILAELVKRYEKQAAEGKISRRGWSKSGVSFGLRISESGEIADLIDLRTEEKRGKKIILADRKIEVPEQAGKTSKIISNFLCDKADYLLGIAGNIERFEVAKKLHLEILKNCNSAAASAVKNFFENWTPEKTENSSILQDYSDDLKKGAKKVQPAKEKTRRKAKFLTKRDFSDNFPRYSGSPLIFRP